MADILEDDNVTNTDDEFSDTKGVLPPEDDNVVPEGEPTEPIEPSEPDAPETKVVHDYEKMFKDTQSAYTKSRQEVAALKAQVKALEGAIVQHQVRLDPKVAEELEELKFSDPEAWRQRLNAIENQKAKEVTSEITRKAEIARRKEVLAQWNEENPDAVITDYIVKNVLPQGITNKLKEGKVSFEGFLAEASNFLRQTKVGPGNSPRAGKKDPMTSVAGKSTASPKKEIEYKDMIF